MHDMRTIVTDVRGVCPSVMRLIAINCLQLLTAILFQILQFIAIVLEVAVIYICCPHKVLLVKN